ncbi:hypothetical protein CCYA_CCYA07G1984 [Cyanidiococcus yangmingshanensis]|nr:hypothetical protein CCYA_CCYA07G1984 [Cyanidiococcus yangmingshanensis]
MFTALFPTNLRRPGGGPLNEKRGCFRETGRMTGVCGTTTRVRSWGAVGVGGHRRRHLAPSGSCRSWRMATQSPGRVSVEEAQRQFPRLVGFLEACKELGELRFIASNAAVVFESTATLEKLFYAEIPRRGLYANVIDLAINLDLHVLLSGIRAARFEQGTSRGDPARPTYIIRFLGHEKQGEEVVLSLFLSPVGEVSAERVTAWKRLRSRFAATDGSLVDVCVF